SINILNQSSRLTHRQMIGLKLPFPSQCSEKVLRTSRILKYPLEAKQEGIASIISVPIVLRERTMGVLRLYTLVPCRLTQDDIDFLSAIATQSGLAIENAKMYEQMKSSYEKLMASPSSIQESSRLE
ncbi:MAG: GAF domain-containing protein, partial [Desulfobacterales bacterium]|nr:GAF domain-containing protein [Desulfobacterales bacterium]